MKHDPEMIERVARAIDDLINKGPYTSEDAAQAALDAVGEENARLREALEGLVNEAQDAYDGIDAVGRPSFYHALGKAEAALKETDQ